MAPQRPTVLSPVPRGMQIGDSHATKSAEASCCYGTTPSSVVAEA